jgi:hypothetical protein
MAYDLWYRRQIGKDISLHLRKPIPETGSPTDSLRLSDDEKGFVAKLSVVKISAEGGNKRAIADWKGVLRSIAQQERKAKQGDAKAKRFVAVVKESGLAGPKTLAMSMGADIPPKGKALVAMLANLKQQARKGDGAAQATLKAILDLRLDEGMSETPSRLWG